MHIRPSLSNAGLLAGHIVLAIGGAAWLALSPPAHGAMMLVPLGDTNESAVFRLAIAAGALPLARGPLPGSLILNGRSAVLASASKGHLMLLIAAPSGGCGALSPEPVR